jgi:DUF971 family protein
MTDNEIDFFPTSLSLSDDGAFEIQWSDGLQQSIPPKVLRDHCPCATCLEKKIGKGDGPPALFPILTAAEAQPLRITAATPVGNYAYRIVFTDGHSTGVYTLEHIRKIQIQ